MHLYARHAAEMIRQGRPLDLVGRLLTARRESGADVLLDPKTGGELAADGSPTWVLSTDGEATDGNILRQEWDVTTRATAGIPVLWNHSTAVVYGRWVDLQTGDLEVDGRPGRALFGRSDFDLAKPEAAEFRRQVGAGYIGGCSVRWIPGVKVRRGSLPSTDPAYRAPEDGLCGPEEGYCMGTREHPNELVECSLVACPADTRAVVTQRLMERADRAAQASNAADFDALLAVLGSDERVRAFLDSRISALLDARSAPAPTAVRLLSDLFPSRS